MMAKPLKTLELYYTMIQFLTILIIPCSTNMVSVHVIFLARFYSYFILVFYIVGIFFYKTIILLALMDLR